MLLDLGVVILDLVAGDVDGDPFEGAGEVERRLVPLRHAAGGSLGLAVLVLLAIIIWRGFDFALQFVIVVHAVVVAVNVVANLIWADFEWIALAKATALIVFAVAAIIAGGLTGRTSSPVTPGLEDCTR